MKNSTSKCGKGEYRKLIMRVPGFWEIGKTSEQWFYNCPFRALVKKRSSWGENHEGVFRKIGRVPGVLAFPIMPQGLRTGGGIESPVQFVILGKYL